MMTMETGAIKPGDYVMLAVRERPHKDPIDGWWKVLAVTDYGLDVVYPAGRSRHIVRRGVSAGCVRAHRQPNEGI